MSSNVKHKDSSSHFSDFVKLSHKSLEVFSTLIPRLDFVHSVMRGLSWMHLTIIIILYIV